MGGGISKPKVVTRRDLLAMTQKPRDFVNQLFQTMITQLTSKELLELGNRGKCKEYVFVMADAIYKTFDSIKVVPTKDKKTGVLFYRKASELTTKEGGEATYEHCLSLSYFYIRIFQIFGALALTVVDDPSAGQVLGYLQQKYVPGQPSKNTLRVRGATPVPFAASFKGGSVYEDESVYKRLKSLNMLFLTPYVSKKSEDTKVFKLEFDSSSNLQLLVSRSDTGVNLVHGPIDGKYTVTKLRSSLRESRGLLVSSNNQYILTMAGFYLTDQNLKQEKQLSGEVRIVVERIDEQFMAKKADSTSDEVRPIVEKLEEILIKKHDELDKKGTVTQATNALGRTVTRTGTDQITQYDVGLTEGLYNGFIIKFLERKDNANPVPFCVARALQLIDANSLDLINPPAIKTHICETSFDSATGVIPRAGESLAKSHGLFALSQLYYSNPHIKKEGNEYKFELNPTDATPGEYVQFLTNMRDLFTRDTSKGPGAKLSDIRFAEPGCDAGVKGKTLQVNDPAAMANMRQTVAALFNLQIEHSKRVIDFMRNKLVQIKSSNVGGVATSAVAIHPNLLKGGVSELNKLAYEARNILVDYYTKCEKTYQLGFSVASRTGKVA